MGGSKKRIKEILLASGLYEPIRRLNFTRGGREAAQARQKMRDFFAKLLPKGSLVFDIGANVGVIAEAFASTGARVVALEPNEECARHIRLMYPGRNIQVIQAAVGSGNGVADLNISSDWDCTCTLSPEFMAKMQEADERYRGNWSQVAVVPVLTLDTLRAHFGEPYFIKIDVEGFEVEVLRGLSKQPPLLSFEFHKTLLESALLCLDSPLWASGSVFNVVESPEWGYPAEFKFAEWMNREQLCNVLKHLPAANGQGDIYVRLEAATS